MAYRGPERSGRPNGIPLSYILMICGCGLISGGTQASGAENPFIQSMAMSTVGIGIGLVFLGMGLWVAGVR